MKSRPKNGLERCEVFFDFDNTITTFDVLDDMITRFSVDDGWVALEREWRAGKIGSRECLRGQLKGIRTTKKTLERYLSGIKVDRHFRRLLGLLKSRGTNAVILSDGFSFIINSILKNNGVRGIRVYSNTLRFRGDRLIPAFPYSNRACLACANCKKNYILANGHAKKTSIFIGDGLSDVCAAANSDIVFAKSALLKNLKKRRRRCVAFRDLGDVYRYFKEMM